MSYGGNDPLLYYFQFPDYHSIIYNDFDWMTLNYYNIYNKDFISSQSIKTLKLTVSNDNYSTRTYNTEGYLTQVFDSLVLQSYSKENFYYEHGLLKEVVKVEGQLIDKLVVDTVRVNYFYDNKLISKIRITHSSDSIIEYLYRYNNNEIFKIESFIDGEIGCQWQFDHIENEIRVIKDTVEYALYNINKNGQVIFERIYGETVRYYSYTNDGYIFIEELKDNQLGSTNYMYFYLKGRLKTEFLSTITPDYWETTHANIELNKQGLIERVRFVVNNNNQEKEEYITNFHYEFY